MKFKMITAAVIVISTGVMASEQGHGMNSMKNGMNHDMSSMKGNPAPMGHDMGVWLVPRCSQRCVRNH